MIRRGIWGMNKLSMKIIIKAMLGMILVVFCVVFGMNIINKNSMDPIERLIHSSYNFV